MLRIFTDDANSAWLDTLESIFINGVETDNDKYFRDETVCIEINKPFLMEPSRLFPMNRKDLLNIVNFLPTGQGENNISHEWTKIYRHRIFDGSPSQADYFIERAKFNLVEGKPAPNPVISIWDPVIDQTSKVQPCALVLWGRIKSGCLELHVHSHSSNAYDKLLMNIMEFISLQVYFASEIKCKIGKFIYFIDSCHVDKKDYLHAKEILDKKNL